MKFPIVGLAIVTLSLLLVGCGSAADPGQTRAVSRSTLSSAAVAAALSPDAPAPTPTREATPTPQDDCTSTLMGSVQRIDTIADMAWMSYRVLVGTVIGRQPSEWGAAPNPLEPNRPLIFTNYLIRVDQRLRGDAGTDVVILRQLGGTIGACTQTNAGAVPLEVGTRAVFFLREAVVNTTPGTVSYYLTGDAQGYWRIDASGAVKTDIGHLQAYTGQPLETFVGLIQAALSTAPPDSPLAAEYFVSIEVAPVPVATAVPTP